MNKVSHISRRELATIRASINPIDVYLVELDGKQINNWKDYISLLETGFKFPTSCIDSIDRYLDWIRDLSWISQKEILLVINNFEYFIVDDEDLRTQIIFDFYDLILPFWEEGVKKFVVGGKPRKFNVYLVEPDFYFDL